MESIGKNRLFVTLFLLLSASILLSQNVIFRAFVDRNTIQEGEVVRYTVEITSKTTRNLPQITLGNLQNFTILGSSSHTSTNYTIINGQTEQKITKTYQFSLEPKGIGTFTIPSISTKIGGKNYRTSVVNITVLKASGQITNTQKTFLLAEISKKDVFIREPFEVNYYLYTEERVEGLRIVSQPDFGNFWKQETFSAKEIRFNQSIVSGKIYNSMLLKSYTLVPQKAGLQQLPTLNMEASIRIGGTDFFDFGRTKTFQLKNKKTQIEVADLPTAPMGYSGSVGRFNFTTSVDKNQLKAGDPLTYTLTIAGEGTFNDDNPTFENLSYFRFSDPEVLMTKQGIKFEKQVKYLVIPKQKGEYKIPSVDFVYFDPKLKDYVKKKTSEFKIKVLPSESFNYSTDLSRADIILKGKDIDFIITDFSLKKVNILFERGFYWSLWVLLCLVLLGAIILNYRNQRLNQNIAYKKRKLAGKMLKKHMKKSATFAKSQSGKFYSEAQDGIVNFLCDKFSITKGSTSQQIFNHLHDIGVQEQIIEDLKQMMQRFDVCRFMPGGFSPKQIQGDYDNLLDLLESITKIQEKR